ncbi:hypothetical protein Ssi02_31320 [Sinosporangium siamense]|uniref:Uncharacterized protein n=1 Tax=Sinosporangium siamense TaxID=1367973 RepID=A0A919RFF0_9ACTN|nr:hypothetical protein Ssi02_31320 [Sinosporangium siamense]
MIPTMATFHLYQAPHHMQAIILRKPSGTSESIIKPAARTPAITTGHSAPPGHMPGVRPYLRTGQPPDTLRLREARS